ncbi:zinc finger mym-type protein 1-like protein [Lasius niger]|uniref:Zinc finger mym-type protein 1-like protein n=1 Tax=Lasius niger TaxID=67767 RepID=A0A0J7K9X2_LASNI|nr:zinc finger mym-type protein 1-like protein [Lasius niger]
MPPKRPSGAEFRKRKREKENEDKKMSKVLISWRKPDLNVLDENRPSNSHIDDIKTSDIVDEICQELVPTTSDPDQTDETVSLDATDLDLNDSTLQDGILEIPKALQADNTSASLNRNDPESWFPLNDSIRSFLIEQGPDQGKESNFSLSEMNNRKFSKEWFKRKLANGQFIERTWLIYNKRKNAIFCFPCILFNPSWPPNPAISSLSDPTRGFNDWRHLSPRIPDHENSTLHRENYIKWKTIEKGLRSKSSINASLQMAIDQEKEKWRHTLRVHIDVIMFCAENNLALRGSNEKIGEPGSGILLSAVNMIAKYNPKLKAHIDTHKKGSTFYFSPLIQNELIELMGTKVKTQIIKEVKIAKYFSILFDCTPDVSHQEQMSQILRYVKVFNGKVSIEERFIDFIHSHEKTGNGLANEILQKLKVDGLNIANIRGQGYDNGTNMSGKYNGVQAKIQQINKYARFVPCAAHSLNLAGINAASVTSDMVTFFGIVQRLFTFFSGSTIRWEVLMKHINISLKCHADTRWSSKAKAVNALYTQLPQVVTALNVLTSDTFNAETIATAKFLLISINYKFVCTLIVWARILAAIDRVNQSLQLKNVTVDRGAKMIQGLTKQIQNFRDENFEKIFNEALKLSEKIGIEGDFVEKRKRAKDQDYNITSKENFTIKIFQVIDTLITHFQWRFEKLNDIAENFNFLSIQSLKNISTENLKKQAADLALNYENDINRAEFLSELESLKFQGHTLFADSESTSSLDLLQTLHQFSLVETCPNVDIALRIFLTLPVTVASCERSFSKLKLIKTYLRSSMGQQRLTNLGILSIENSIARQLDYENIIDEFASRKARKVTL